MGKLPAFFKLIRWKNLLIIFLTQGLLWACIEHPFNPLNTGLFLQPTLFFLLSLSTLLIAAGGNLINDVYDVEIDLINKPDAVIIGKQISRSGAFFVYGLLNLIGIGIGFYLSRVAGNIGLVLIQLTSFLLLLAYAARWKKRFLLGNLVISILTALSILILPAYESGGGLLNIFHGFEGMDLKAVFAFLFYAYFAFWTTLIREIIKDMEDVEGDRAMGGNTLPIKLGLVSSARIVRSILIFLIISLLIVALILLLKPAYWTAFYFFPFLVGLVLIFLMKTGLPNTIEKAGNWSGFIKIFMILGLLSVLFYRFL